MTPLVVTGLGVASALGVGANSFFFELATPCLLSKKGVMPIQSFDAATYANAELAEIPHFDPAKWLGDKGLRTLDRLTKLLLVTARQCLEDAGLKKDGTWSALGPERVGVVCSNAYGSLEAITELDRVAKLEDARYINPAKFPNTVSNSASGYISIWEDLRALNVTVSTGNCGGLDATSCTDMFLASNRADSILTGGGEAMSEALFVAISQLGVLGSNAFETRLGEGAAFLALESPAQARDRGARVRGAVLGYGTAFVAPADGPVIFASEEGMSRAIRFALSDAGLDASQVDLVVAGVAGLDPFDEKELAAIRSVFGEEVAVVAPKLSLGETLGGGGALGMAAALAWLGGTRIAVDLMVCGNAPSTCPRYVVVTALGYYGNASAVVMGGVSSVERPQATARPAV